MDDESLWRKHKWNMTWCFVGIVGGGVFGHILDKPSSNAHLFWQNTICGAGAHLRRGKNLRSQAVDLALQQPTQNQDTESSTISSLHRAANKEFSAAQDCGSLLGQAHLGQAYCFGWGVEKTSVNYRKGRNLIVSAAQGDPSLIEWLLNPVYCHS